MGISQRKAAAALGISQALLSHYENGIREPGLAFVARACDFYHVSADFLLGRTSSRDGSIIEAAELYDASDEKGTLKGSILATLQKKLVVNTTGVLFDLLGKCGDRTAITAAGDYLSTALYTLLRHLYRCGGGAGHQSGAAEPLRKRHPGAGSRLRGAGLRLLPCVGGLSAGAHQLPRRVHH